MDSKNFTLQTKVKFRGNFSSYDKQPIVTLVDNDAITGGKFISIYRIRRGREDSLSITGDNLAISASDGILGLSFGDGIGLTSLSGSQRMRSQSLTSGDSGLTANWGTPVGGAVNNTILSTTADEREYNINLIVDGNNKISVVVEDKEVFFGDIEIAKTDSNPPYNHMGMGFRPNSCSVSADGQLGSSLISQYYYNRMEKQVNFSVDGLTGIQDWSGNSITAGIYGKAAGGMAGFAADNTVTATVTGWTHGPIEGGFKLDGSSYIESNSSSLFNTRHINTSGITVMTHVKFFSTGDTNILTIGACGSTLAGLALRNGAVEFSANGESVTAGALSSTTNAMANQNSVQLNEWLHIAATIHSGTASTTGAAIFINGEKTTLARSTTSLSGAVSTYPVVNNDARMIIGKNMDRTVSGLTGVIGLTRIFSRPLNDAEVFENFITSIPSQVVVNEINIA